MSLQPYGSPEMIVTPRSPQEVHKKVREEKTTMIN